jgi:hypothetical protein
VRLWSLGAQTFRSRTTDRFRVRVSPPWTKGVKLGRSSSRNLTASVRARTLTPGASKARQCTTALNGSPGEAYCLAHHVTVTGGRRSLMVASLRYHDTFVKMDGTWIFAQRLLYVDWVDEHTLP